MRLPWTDAAAFLGPGADAGNPHRHGDVESRRPGRNAMQSLPRALGPVAGTVAAPAPAARGKIPPGPRAAPGARGHDSKNRAATLYTLRRRRTMLAHAEPARAERRRVRVRAEPVPSPQPAPRQDTRCNKTRRNPVQPARAGRRRSTGVQSRSAGDIQFRAIPVATTRCIRAVSRPSPRRHTSQGARFENPRSNPIHPPPAPAPPAAAGTDVAAPPCPSQPGARAAMPPDLGGKMRRPEPDAVQRLPPGACPGGETGRHRRCCRGKARRSMPRQSVRRRPQQDRHPGHPGFARKARRPGRSALHRKTGAAALRRTASQRTALHPVARRWMLTPSSVGTRPRTGTSRSNPLHRQIALPAASPRGPAWLPRHAMPWAASATAGVAPTVRRPSHACSPPPCPGMGSVPACRAP